MTTSIVLLIVLLAILIASLITFLVTQHYFKKKLQEAIKESLRGQRSKISGDILEKFCPFSPNYHYNLRDVVAIFDTFDFMVLKGRSDGMIEEVIIQEMKSTPQSLKPNQRQLRDCIKAGKVRFEHWQFSNELNEWQCKPIG